MTKIATGETEKNEVVHSTLSLFFDKFQNFRSGMERVNRYFAPKGQGLQGEGGWGGGRGGQDGGWGQGGWGRGGADRGRGGESRSFTPIYACSPYLQETSVETEVTEAASMTGGTEDSRDTEATMT